MSSQRRIDASRANGALSHGPKTPEGRALSAAAALTHGLTARRTLVGNESEEAFRALRDVYTLYFQPENRLELDWLEEFIASRWRLIRITSMETALLTLEVDHQEPDVKKQFEVCETETRIAWSSALSATTPTPWTFSTATRPASVAPTTNSTSASKPAEKSARAQCNMVLVP